MSLKAVELQVALPRTQDISRIQEQQQQRTMHEQLFHISEQVKLTEQQRQRTADVNETAKSLIKEKEEKQKKQKTQDTESDTKEGKNSKGYTNGGDRSLMQDPLRGRHIDISL